MTVKSLQVMLMGIEEGVDKGFFTFRVDEGQKIDSGFLCFLIKTDEGNILIDTGPHPDDAEAMSKITSTKFKHEKPLMEQLQQISLSPDDINTVVLTHLHWDHVGWLTHFPNADVVVQKDEYLSTLDPEPYARFHYLQNRYKSPKIKWKLIEGDHILIPGVTLLLTPGHTAGSQSVMVNLPEFGPILLVGDTGFLQENFEKEIIPIYFGNPRQALLSIRRLKTWSMVTKAPILTTHDVEYWRKHVKKSPECYT